MASELRVNTLKDASGNNSVATSTVAQGSAKAWAHIAAGGASDTEILTASILPVLMTKTLGQFDGLNYTTNMLNANMNLTFAHSLLSIMLANAD